MKIRVRYFISIIVLIIIGAYSIGCMFPIFGLNYVVSNEPVNQGAHINNLITLFACLGNVGAVIVALFKAELQGLFKSVDLDFKFVYENACEVLTEESIENPKAKLYYNDLVITNNGNVNALNSQVHIDEISFRKDQDVHDTPITIDKTKLNLGSDSVTFISANGGYKRVRIFVITSSQDPEGNSKTILKIGENVVQCSHGGLWIIKCCVNVENAKPYNFRCEIKWDGNWHSRINEMQIESKVKKMVKNN